MFRWRWILKATVVGVLGIIGVGAVMLRPMTVVPIDQVYAVYDTGLTVFRSGDRTVIVAHATEARTMLHGPSQYHIPLHLVDELLRRGDLSPGEDVLIVCCYPGEFEPGESAGVSFKFVDTTRKPLVLFWCTRWLVVTESRFGL